MQANVSYPAALIATARDAWRSGDTKTVLVSDIAPPTERKGPFGEALPMDAKWCVNCGGVGQFNLFIADEGPYQSPFHRHNKVAHWHEGVWYIGKSTNFDCPICKGLGYIRKVFQQREFA